MTQNDPAAPTCPVHHMRGPEKFNPFTPQYHANLYGTFDTAREEQPVFFSPVMNLWVVTRYDDVKAVLKDPEAFSSAGAVAPLTPEILRLIGGPDGPIQRTALVNSDPPLHTRFRNTFQKAFTPRQVSRLEPEIRELTQSLLADLGTNKRLEAVQGLCDPLPLLTICRLMGVPDKDAADIKRWSADSIRASNPALDIEGQRVVAQSMIDFYTYMVELTRHYAAHPAENLISAVVEAQTDSEEPLSFEEIGGLSRGLVLAGHETSAALLGNTLQTLLTQRELWDALCAHPERISGAVDEFLRHGGPAVGLFRQATRDVQFGEVTIPKNARVWVTYLAGNHDPAQFPDPQRLDLERPNAANHLSLGYGIHYCIGAPLAKLELRVALEEMTKRYPGLRLDAEQEIEHRPNFVMRGLKQLVLVTD
ncbi:cytochrome P450 [Deinococcus sp.]|uniref:cytochrome P450 n=1 Tax=Deinococcus sp. TaxID=47478 RepID=UPI003CC5D5BB